MITHHNTIAILYQTAIAMLWLFFPLYSQQITIEEKQIDINTKQIIFSFPVHQKDFIYKDFITFSVSDPSITLSEWESHSSPINYYDPLFKTTKAVFVGAVTIVLNATKAHGYTGTAQLYCTYYQRSKKKMLQIKHLLSFVHDITPESTPPSLEHAGYINNINKPYPKTQGTVRHIIDTYKNYCSRYSITHTIHLCLILMLLLLCIIPPYFFTKKLHHSIQLYELITIITATSLYILMTYILFFISAYSKPEINRLMLTLCTGSIGIFYTKKSTIFQWHYLKHLSSFLGMLLIATTIVLFFTMT